MVCKVHVAALVYRVITGITSGLLAKSDVQPRVRCAVMFSGLHCVTIYIPLHQEDQSPIAHVPVFCLQPDNQQEFLAPMTSL
jgi:hypothetical protein